MGFDGRMNERDFVREKYERKRVNSTCGFCIVLELFNVM